MKIREIFIEKACIHFDTTYPSGLISPISSTQFWDSRFWREKQRTMQNSEVNWAGRLYWWCTAGSRCAAITTIRYTSQAFSGEVSLEAVAFLRGRWRWFCDESLQGSGLRHQDWLHREWPTAVCMPLYSPWRFSISQSTREEFGKHETRNFRAFHWKMPIESFHPTYPRTYPYPNPHELTVLQKKLRWPSHYAMGGAVRNRRDLPRMEKGQLGASLGSL